MKEEEEETLLLHGEKDDNQKEKREKEGLLGFILGPINWFRMLCKELHWSFVLGVMIVYGINHGMSLGLSRVATKYYMKDDQKVQPYEAQVYAGIVVIPWIVKPLWGFLTDTVPISGYRRRPYFFLSGFIGIISMLVLSLQKKLDIATALLCLVAGSTGVGIADVTIDACITEKSIRHSYLAADMQTLGVVSSSIGGILGFSLSGFLVKQIGPKGVYGVLCIPYGLVIVVGIMLRESTVNNIASKRVNQKFLDVGKSLWTALECRDVWQPCLYIYLSLALAFQYQEGMFYWYTDAKEGPSFSKETVGTILSTGTIGSLIGALLYQKVVKNHPFRQVLLWTQLLYGASGMLDLILILRINLKLGLPDYLFVVIDNTVDHIVNRLKWMPLLILSVKLCPSGIEGTFLALIKSIDEVGILSSDWAGGLVLQFLSVTRSQFDNLWIAILVRSLARISPIVLLFLVPKSDPNTQILPIEMLGTKHDCDDDDDDGVSSEIPPLVTTDV